MLRVSIQGQKERGSFLHDPHPRMGVPVDVPLVPLGLSEEAFQIQVVRGKVQQVISDEQAWSKPLHDAADMLTERIGIGREPDPDLIELPPALL